MLKKFIASLAGLLFVGSVAVVNTIEDCYVLDENKGKQVFFPAVEVEYGDSKVCFEKESDYQLAKTTILQDVKDNENLKVNGTLAYVENMEDAVTFLVIMMVEGERENINKQVIDEYLFEGNVEKYNAATSELDKLMGLNNIATVRKK